jgi:hypothetical protein
LVVRGLGPITEVGCDGHGNAYLLTDDVNSSGGHLRSVRADGSERWRLELPMVSLAAGPSERLAVNAHGDIAISVAGTGDITLGPFVIPHVPLPQLPGQYHCAIALVRGR